VIARYLALIAAVTWLALPSGTAQAAPGQEGSATGTASAQIAEPIQLELLAPLEFGTVAIGPGESGSITIAPDGSAPGYSGALSASCAGTAFCNAQPARFAVRGEASRYYRVRFPDQVEAHALGHNGPALMITEVTIMTLSQPDQGSRGRLDTAGRDEVRIGGALQIPSGTPAGRYRATFDLVVSYD
jgi:hypothetical protein